MMYLDLFLGFLKVGCFAFGGAYGAIPLIRDVVMDYGWLNDEMLTYMIAVSESTPGPIMVNVATYVGIHQAGFPDVWAPQYRYESGTECGFSHRVLRKMWSFIHWPRPRSLGPKLSGSSSPRGFTV